jgi:hypothetical protein
MKKTAKQIANAMMIESSSLAWSTVWADEALADDVKAALHEINFCACKKISALLGAVDKWEAGEIESSACENIAPLKEFNIGFNVALLSAIEFHFDGVAK